MAIVDPIDLEKALVDDDDRYEEEAADATTTPLTRDSDARRRRERRRRRKDSKELKLEGNYTWEFWSGAVLCVPQLTFGTMFWGRCQPLPGELFAAPSAG
jgi:hypothetical protein